MITILITGMGYGEVCRAELEKIWEDNGCRVIEEHGPMKESQLLEHPELNQIDAIIVYSSSDEITARVMESAENLKVVSRHGLGIDNIDTEAASRLNIKVTATRNCNEEASVADYTMGLMLALARDIPNMSAKTKAGNWYRPLTTDVNGKTLGIIGLGRIGKLVAQRARAFDMKLIAYDPFEDQAFAKKYDVDYVELENLIKQADFISINCSLNAQTQDMIGSEELSMMKNTAYLVNCGRGAIVNEWALYQALKKEQISGAAVDVYTHEPPFEDNNPLFYEQLDNLIATSHTAVYTKEVIRNMDLEATQNIIKNIL